LPPWILNQWKQVYGPEEAIQLAKALLQKAPVTFFSPVKSREELLSKFEECKVSATATEVSKRTVCLDTKTLPISMEELSKLGYFIDEASCAVTEPFSHIKNPGKILDACSAPGGKLLGMLKKVMECEGSSITSNDPSATRMRILQANLRRVFETIPQISFSQFSLLRKPQGWEDQKFNTIFADLPCSGMGVIRRHPQIPLKLTTSSLEKVVTVQRQILNTCLELLEPDGLLIMSICSFHPKESEETVKQFLNKGLNHYPEYYESLHESVERTDHGAYFYPHKTGTDGFFLAAFKKQ